MKWGKLLDMLLPAAIALVTREVQKRAEKREKKKLDRLENDDRLA